jgi:hypothetical protein
VLCGVLARKPEVALEKGVVKTSFRWRPSGVLAAWNSSGYIPPDRPFGELDAQTVSVASDAPRLLGHAGRL